MFSTLITYGSAINALLTLARKLVELGEKSGWIEEGERRFIYKEALANIRALKIRDKVKAEKLTVEELFREMEGSFID